MNGAQKKGELQSFSPRIDAAEALRLGLLTAIYPADELEKAAYGLAR